ncbi:hypothetical protein [Mangrovibacterium diazotrophicum]|uniref:Uncharacterized protein n=1 Tax=Mangrovibacterium diazotrophicum TaxID=1261403 RepID=A0A419WAU7_9BACT|nr:hypothetical protein [Mangrovibacterium diazotrophicum]RKD92532.1 hypothetical protein BC643_2906 [Mangrovibacterium diazotrophicum]
MLVKDLKSVQWLLSTYHGSELRRFLGDLSWFIYNEESSDFETKKWMMSFLPDLNSIFDRYSRQQDKSLGDTNKAALSFLGSYEWILPGNCTLLKDLSFLISTDLEIEEEQYLYFHKHLKNIETFGFILESEITRLESANELY